ncbi:hypothetical protein [Amycolatopsis keratiniphila]|uniref:Uncharacterized protein n=1 Tax=Amycolatopsis keratiniphila subsp. keratiniphila TaxID=227715 RepID=A0A1W2LXA7_9PSEU|nr:hypothetical protein [Amycolatopsis keratiniphila]ONF71554.1 hypothetical protein AVR91_0212865 [Amycolatopsis keratiniphila subsp. keratiniphila]
MLQALVDGAITPAQADDWARRWMVEGGIRIEDELVLQGLGWLFGADLMASPSSYLHGPADFRAWLEEFDAHR